MPASLRLLALEAGGERISAALLEGDVVIAAAFEDAKQRQTERLAPLVQGLLGQAGWTSASLGAIAAGRGPGSFTGLRSSLALGQGFALGSPARLIGVDTLTVWAEASGHEKVAVALDGRRGQAYFGRFTKGLGAWSAVEAPRLMDQSEAWGLAQGWPLLSDLEPPQERLALPQGADLAKAVGQLAWARWQGRSGAPLDWEPLYLRRAEVEILWEKLHPKAGA